MEGSLSSGNMISGIGGSSYGGLDLQGSMRLHHQQHNNPFTLHQHHHHHNHLLPNRQQGSIIHSSIHENFSLTMQDSDDYAQGERVNKSLMSDEDEPNFTEDAYGNGGKKAPTWHRVKWNESMVRLLITAVSYIGEDAAIEYGGGVRRKCSNLQKKGKWKLVSKVMAERGHFVSPQQCEDKFNDLNKRYKRLNEILGRGTSCEVVEKPNLLDLMDHVSDKEKEEVRKILSSKHLHYEEMCSYHNGNRLHLPPDPELQRSLRLALRSGNDQESHDLDDENQDLDMDDHDEYEEHHHTKRIKQFEDLDCNKKFASQPKNVQTDMNQALPDGVKTGVLQEQWMKQRLVQLEEQQLQIQARMLELEKERFKWQSFRRQKDRELEAMRMENERMKLENEQMAFELKRMEMCADII